jgi:hypothetical protein
MTKDQIRETLQVEDNQVATAGALEVTVGVAYRGFAFREFVWVIKTYVANPDYCPDPDDYLTGPRGWEELVVHRLVRAIRIKTGEEFVRGYSIDECKTQIDANIGKAARKEAAIPF